MMVIGVVLLVLGYWLLPMLLVPGQLVQLAVGLGWFFLVVGAILLVLSVIGHPVGNRRYWY